MPLFIYVLLLHDYIYIDSDTPAAGKKTLSHGGKKLLENTLKNTMFHNKQVTKSSIHDIKTTFRVEQQDEVSVVYFHTTHTRTH